MPCPRRVEPASRRLAAVEFAFVAAVPPRGAGALGLAFRVAALAFRRPRDAASLRITIGQFIRQSGKGARHAKLWVVICRPPGSLLLGAFVRLLIAALPPSPIPSLPSRCLSTS